jgi:endonuclease VIII
MPEGHTIHRAAQDHRKMLVGKILDVSSPQGYFLEGAEILHGKTCVSIEAYGKHLFYLFDHGETLHIHLGLFGRFRTAKTPAAEPRGAVRVRMISPTHVVDINGPNTCELLSADELATRIARIGPDVLREDADKERAWQRIHKSRTAFGQLLMDQAVVAGVGNIYRTELLWRARLHPRIPGNQIDRTMFDTVWADAIHLLHIGVKNNAIITVDNVKKSRSRYGERVNIFGKAICPQCAGDIEKFEMATRRVYLCQTCQPLNVEHLK